jgi:general secretion pathway protein D
MPGSGESSVKGFVFFARSTLALFGAAALASAQPVAPTAPSGPQATQLSQPQQRITPNFKDADITQIAEAVAAATGKNFIMDPRVRAQVTMLSSTPMSPEGFYQAFLSILAVYDFIAVPDGNVVKILPDANARQMPSIDLPDHVSATSDEIVTQVIDVKNVNAAQLVPILRPMIPQYGHLAAYPAGNILIISDRASNVNRMIRIIRRIDQVGDQDVEIVQLRDASASEIVRTLNSLYQGAAAAAEGGTPMKVVADERSNSVLISGDQNQRLRIRALVAHLDTPLETGGDTRVRYLHYANADKIAPKLKEQMTGIAQAAAGGTTGGAPGGGGSSPQAQAEKNSLIWADPSNNALVITAPPKVMRQIMAIIDKLDIRRPQVLVEAIIADVDVSKDAELGVNWAAFGQGSNVPAAGFVSPVGGTSIVDLAQAIENPSSVSSTLLNGTTLGIGRIGSGAVNFAAVLRAIQSTTHTNIIATPSAVTMDDEEAELKVAQEVPFVTGQFTSTGSASNGAVNPFQTIQNEEVGTILKVTPTISAEGTAVQMKLSIESSSLAPTSTSTTNPTTNKRTVTTNVLVEDGGVVVLGGLIQDQNTKTESKVPLLGSIPIIGLAFKTRSNTTEKSSLMIFLRPKILRDQAQSAYETDLKYNYMQDEEKSFEHREIPPLLPGEKQPRLPPLPPPPPPGTEAAPISLEEKEKAAEEQARADDALNRRSLTPPRAPTGTGATPATTLPPQSSTTSPGLPAPTTTAAPASATSTSPPQEGEQR